MVQLLTLNTHLLELTQKLPVGNWPLKLWWRCSNCSCPIAPNSIPSIFWQVCWGKEGYIVPGLQLLVSSQPVTFETLPCKPLLSISLEQLESSSPGPLGLIQGLWIWPMGWVAISLCWMSLAQPQDSPVQTSLWPTVLSHRIWQSTQGPFHKVPFRDQGTEQLLGPQFL